MTLAIILATLVLNVLANSFVKMGMTGFAGGVGGGMVMHMIRNPYMVLGVGCYGLAFVTYSALLTRLDLSVAYPLMTGCIAVTLAAVAVAFFGESLSLPQGAGILLVVAGIWLLAR